ncbi:hypothetical protein GQX74_005172 [Glossina fuscipes]|nr:hypothetical protein GQX74_005172 [Glossina fuscipes]
MPIKCEVVSPSTRLENGYYEQQPQPAKLRFNSAVTNGLKTLPQRVTSLPTSTTLSVSSLSTENRKRLLNANDFLPDWNRHPKMWATFLHCSFFFFMWILHSYAATMKHMNAPVADIKNILLTEELVNSSPISEIGANSERPLTPAEQPVEFSNSEWQESSHI